MDELKWMIARQIPHLRRYAIVLTKSETQADDLVQDCLERGLRKRHLWHRTGSLRSWLFRMLYRTHIDRQRSRRREDIPVEAGVVDAAVTQPPEQEHAVELRNITDALDRLPGDQRATVLLVALEGFAYDEVAEIMDVPVGTVRSRLSRGRQTLRELLTREEPKRVLRRVK